MKTNSSGQAAPGQSARVERILANGLGLFSVGLGLAELFAASRVAKLVGVDRQLALIRAMGVRELGSGAGLLSQRASHRWAWSRVGGDLLDLAMLGMAARAATASRNRLAIAAAAVAGVAVFDYYCSRRFSRNGGGARRGQATHFNTSITIDRSAEDLYQAWRNLEDLPRFMNHLIRVQKTGENVWRWCAKGPAGSQVEWDAEIVEDVPGERIVWRSLEQSTVEHSGSVRFEAGSEGRGTRVTVNLVYQPPAGKFGARVARLLGQSPEKQIPVDLHRFKQWMETGEIATTRGQPAGRSSGTAAMDDMLQS